MVLEDWVKLNGLRLKLLENSLPLKVIKEVYYQAKIIFSERLSHFDGSDLKVLLDIFSSGTKKVGKFWDNWQDGSLSPTDEELDLLEEAFEEGSWVFNQLSIHFPHLLSPQANQIKQQLIQKNKQLIAEEKQRRENPNPNPNPNPNQSSQSNSFSTFLKEHREVFFFFVILVALLIMVISRMRKRR